MATILVSAAIHPKEYRVKLEYQFTEDEINSEYLLKWETMFYLRGGADAQAYIMPELTIKPKSTAKVVRYETIRRTGSSWLGMQFKYTYKLFKLELISGKVKRQSLDPPKK